MKLSRRNQVLPSYAYCRHSLCTWRDSGTHRGIGDLVEQEATRHVRATMHEVRLVTARETILTFPAVEATR